MTTVWTVGHWTCPEEAFIGLLRAENIEMIADVRSHPGSRRSPQFGREAMRGWLSHAGIHYVHLPALGGRRSKQDVGPGLNAGWRQPSFKNYADYTLTSEYEQGIAQLIDLAATQRLAILCAEPTPWRCHRLLISNTLTVHGMTVQHHNGWSWRPGSPVGQLGRDAAGSRRRNDLLPTGRVSLVSIPGH